jgi:hypothetical protein
MGSVSGMNWTLLSPFLTYPTNMEKEYYSSKPKLVSPCTYTQAAGTMTSAIIHFETHSLKPTHFFL